MRRMLFPCTVGFLTAMLGLTGCGKKKPDVIPVTGKVHLGADVITSGQVTFIPMDEGASGDLSTGSINSNGEYKIFTNQKHGAPAGKYKVTVTPPMTATTDGKPPTFPYHPRFGDASKTTLQVEVKPDAPPGYYNLLLAK